MNLRLEEQGEYGIMDDKYKEIEGGMETNEKQNVVNLLIFEWRQ
jgi:hypothetical protein